MKFFILAIAISVAYTAKNTVNLAAKDPQVMLGLFGEFQKTYNKHYSNFERRMRLANFNRFVKFAANLNERDDGVEYGITFFADLTEAEADRLYGANTTLLQSSFRADRFLGSSDSSDSDSSDSDSDSDEEPTSEEPTTEGPTTEKPTTEGPTTDKPTTEGPTTEKPTTEGPPTEKPTTEEPTDEGPTDPLLNNANNVVYGAIKNQDPLGSCWAFAAAALIEGHAFLTTGRYTAFSEQEILDCTGRRSTANGGYIHEGLEEVQRHNHLASMASYPYEQRKGRCRRMNHANALPFRITSTNMVSGDNRMLNGLRQAPVTPTMSFPKALEAYRGGNYNDPFCSNSGINHCVTVIAYSRQSWTVRNSWGANWGENGNIRFSRAVDNICNISVQVNTITVQRTVQEEEE